MTSDRKAAIAAYKERKTIAGIFVIRSKASAEQWVGQAPNLETDPEPDLVFAAPGQPHLPQPAGGVDRAWARQSIVRGMRTAGRGRDAYVRKALLKERMLHWRAQLGAEAV